jgi:hypothetical protein
VSKHKTRPSPREATKLRILPSDRTTYIEALGENADCLLSPEEITDWAGKLGRLGDDGERELKQLLILACCFARPFSSKGSSVEDDRKVVKQLRNLAKRISEIHTELSKLPENAQAALAARVIFRAEMDHDKGMAWLGILPRMLGNVAEVWRQRGPEPESRNPDTMPSLDCNPPTWHQHPWVGQPSLEPQSFVIDILYEVVEKFTREPLPSPRSKNKHCGLNLVRFLVRKIFPPATTSAKQIDTMFVHFHKRWLLKKRNCGSVTHLTAG